MYEIQGLLGRGATGAVYRVRDQESGGLKALKLLRPSAIASLTRREFRILSRLHHPGCVRVHAIGRDHTHGAYLLMDLVEGRRPPDVIGTGQSDDLLLFARRVLETLAYLHDHHVFHGDLKPGNVRCAHGLASQPVLLDFGLATSQRDVANIQGGTLVYMAPELLRGAPRDARTDLYAVGVMLYALAAGSAPVRGVATAAIMHAHLHEVPTPLQDRVPNVSRPFSDFVARLLAKAPGERPATAREALWQFAECTGMDVGVNHGAPEREAAMGTPELTGRDDVVATFDDLWSEARRGRGGVLVVFGHPGSGRSRILEETAVRGQLRGARILRWDASRSDGLSAALGALYRDRSPSVREELQRRIQALQAEPVKPQPVLELFHSLPTSDCILILVDNLKQGGGEAAELASAIARGCGRLRAMMVLACDDLAALGDGLSDWVPARYAALTPLSRSETSVVINSALGHVEGEPLLAGWLHRETNGNIGSIVETLRWLIASDALARARGRWFLRERLADLTGLATTGGLPQRRLAPVQGTMRAVLRGAAVMGYSFDLDVVLQALGQHRVEEPVFAQLLRAHVVLPDEQGRWPYRFGQRAFVGVLLAELPKAEQRQLHGHVAEALLERSPDDGIETLADLVLLSDVARHLIGAGDWRRGLPLARAAAERGDLSRARFIDLLREALAVMDGDVPLRERVELHRDLADLAAADDRDNDARRGFVGTQTLLSGPQPDD